MRILFAGANDWANVSNRVARGLNAAAGETIAHVFTINRHPFGYEEDQALAGDHNRENLWTWARECDWVISTGDGDYRAFARIVESLPLPTACRFATAHVGSQFRNNAELYEELDRGLGFQKRFVIGDLYRFAKDDIKAIPYYAPTHAVGESIVPLGDGPVRIAHSPSNRANKGTEGILAVFRQLRTDFPQAVEIDLIEGVSFNECARRRAQAHIFVDQVSHIGTYGASSVEAMAFGCATIADTHNICPDVHRFYPPPPLTSVADLAELRHALRWWIEDREALQAVRHAGWRWARERAAPAPVGRYWLSHLE